MGTAYRGYVTAYMNATGNTESIKSAGVVVFTINDVDNFSGTVLLQRKAPGSTAFYTLASGSYTDADFPVYKQMFEGHPDAELRASCSTYSSGTCEISISSAAGMVD